MRAAELAELALRLRPGRGLPRGHELGRRALELRDRAPGVAGPGERAAGERARERGLDGGADACGVGSPRRARARAAAAGSSASRTARARAARHRARHEQRHGFGSRLGARGRPLGLRGAAEREPAARQQLEALGPPAARDEQQLLASGRCRQRLDGALAPRRPRGARRRGAMPA